MVKTVVKTNMYKTGLQDLLKVLNEHHSETFPNILFLLELGLIMPLHTSHVERGFSAQNNIVIANRNMISPKTVNKLMLIKCEGGNIIEQNFDASVYKWKAVKNRRIVSLIKK